jgi:DNA-directed RNA polymerase subunit beta
MPKPAKVVVEAGSKITPRLARKLAEGAQGPAGCAMKTCTACFIADDMVDASTGLRSRRGRFDELDEKLLDSGGRKLVTEFRLLDIDMVNTVAYIRNTLMADKNAEPRASADRHLPRDAPG